MISKCIIGVAGGLSPFCAVYPHDHHPLWSQHIIHLFLKLPQQLWVKLLLWSGPKCLENPTEGKLTWDSKATGTAQWTQNQQKKVTQTLHFPSLNLPKEGSLGRPIFSFRSSANLSDNIRQAWHHQQGGWIGSLTSKKQPGALSFLRLLLPSKDTVRWAGKPLRCPHFTWRLKMLLPITIISKCIWSYLEQFF